MSEFDQPTPLASMEDQRRKAALRARLETNAAAMTQAAMQAHQQDHDIVTAGQGGLYGSATPQQLAAQVAARHPRVGGGAGAGRDLVALGGSDLVAHAASGPAPARVDLTRIGQPVQPAGEMMSPVVRHQRGL